VTPDLVPGERLFFRPDEVARLFRVDPKTVGRWAAAGRLPGIKTPGGRWRFPVGPVRDLLANATDEISTSRNTERATTDCGGRGPGLPTPKPEERTGVR
jgi:excisionase family DNA binding protein